MESRLSKKLEELRRYYSDEQIAEDFSKYADQYAKDGFNKKEILDFAAAVKQDPGVLGSIWQGAKRETDKFASGATQTMIEGRKLWGNMTGNETKVKTSNMALESLAQEEAIKNANLENTRQQHPFATAVGETVPAMLPTGRAGAGRWVSPAVTYGAFGLGQYGTPEERVARGATNAASNFVGAGGADMASAVISPAKAPLTAEQKRSLGAMRTQAQDAGTEFRPPLSDLTQSPTIANIEDTISRIPFAQDVVSGQSRARQDAVNKVAAKSIGQVSTSLGEETVTAAYKSVDDAYGALRAVKNKAFQMGPSLSDAADNVIKNQSMKMTPDAELVKYATEAKRLVTLKSKLTGEAVDALRQEIAKKARAVEGGDSVQWYRLLEGFDDSVRQSASSQGLTDVAANLDKARNTLRNLKTIDKPNVIRGGDVKGQSLRTRVATEGNKDPGLNAIGDYYGAFPPIQPGSQTFQRAFWPWAASQPYAGGAAVAGATALGKAMDSDIVRQYMVNGLLFDPALSPALAMGVNPMFRGLGQQAAENGVFGPVFGKQ